MKENQIEEIFEVFKELKHSSRVSITLIAVGILFLLGSVFYSATRLRPLEDEIKTKLQEIVMLKSQEDVLNKKIVEKQKEFEQLKTNVEKLYSVRVTPTNEVYELKATAKATGRKLSNDLTEYEFKIYVNTAPEVLKTIRRVVYTFNHPTFKEKQQVADNANSRFETGYRGWGCLTKVGIEVELKSGTKTQLDFDMCKSLGLQWRY